MPSAEGILHIHLRPGVNSPGRVVIVSSRPVHASRLLEGKRVDEALSLLPLLFRVCGVAQSCAGVQACEAALVRHVDGYTRELRHALVNMESLREQLWRIFLDWPVVLGEAVNEQAMASVIALQREHRRLLCGDENPFLPGREQHKYANTSSLDTMQQRLEDLLEEMVFAMPVAAWLKLEDRQSLNEWAGSGKTAAGRLINRIHQSGWDSAGACAIDALPVMPDERIDELLRRDAFVEQPDWEGHCRETGSLVRNDSPLLDDLRDSCRNGLLTRQVARLMEIAHLTKSLKPVAASAEKPASLPAGTGVGQTAAARGQLVHRVLVKENRIARYQILAPTEWNFHPDGVVARALSTLSGNSLQVEEQARLLINAIDPCVDYELRIG